jgi:phage tail-like protein
MPSDRPVPYGAFNFLVEFIGGQGQIMGGFSDVSGINTELTMADYRAGNDPENHVRKVPGVHKVGDVTLKRGIVDSSDFWTWISETRTHGYSKKRDVVITLRDEAGTAVQWWKLFKVAPMKYAGPSLAAKGGGEVAMEELVLSAEGLEVGRA